jgi:hypothetical protein
VVLGVHFPNAPELIARAGDDFRVTPALGREGGGGGDWHRRLLGAKSKHVQALVRFFGENEQQLIVFANNKEGTAAVHAQGVTKFHGGTGETHSCKEVFALQGAGRTSPSALLTMAVRPPSVGRVSSQNTSLSQVQVQRTILPAWASICAVMGDGQAPG